MLLSKAEARRRLLAARAAQDVGVRDEADHTLSRAAADLVVSRGCPIIAAYVPVRGEPGGSALVPALAALDVRLLLPVLLPDNDLDWAEHTGTLVPGRHGLLEPAGPRLGREAIASAGVVVAPGLGADRQGTRLGRGGGSYDRALARAMGLVVMLVYEGELVDHLPSQPHDRPVHLVYDGAHGHWTNAGRMSHHWHSKSASASVEHDGG